MIRLPIAIALSAGILLAAESARAFCGFYVAKADTKLFNEASQVAIARDGDRTVLTMANDYQGELEEFAVVIPVPTFIERGQINVADPALMQHLDAFTAPRLVEYFDPNPCEARIMRELSGAPLASFAVTADAKLEAKSLGVSIEASYTVGEYDILILSAEQSDGLETWLRRNDYRVPDGASRVLGSYIKQGMRFFVAKVNLGAQSKLGFSYLRPLQVAYESPKFMLPIRLGMLNANGPQELFVYTLTRNGRVETTNYRTSKLPTGMDIPVYVRERFDDFYRGMFTQQVANGGMRTVFLEYAWDMGWCDPCAAEPLSRDEVRQLGVFWMDATASGRRRQSTVQSIMPVPQPVNDVFVTRLHVRYDAQNFPEDLFFQQTGNRDNFQARYVLRHPWKGRLSCPGGNRYQEELRRREEQAAQNLASLTGWDINSIRAEMNIPKEGAEDSDDKWWKKLWGQ